MLIVRNSAGLRARLVPAIAVLSFAMMVLAVPLIRDWHLERFIQCPFRCLTGLACPTCGYTRFWTLAQNGHWMEAICFQPFIPVILAGATASAIYGVYCLSKNREFVITKSIYRMIWGVLLLSWTWNLYFKI